MAPDRGTSDIDVDSGPTDLADLTDGASFAVDGFDDGRGDRLADRWSALSVGARGAIIAVGALVLGFVAYNTPGIGPFLDDKAPRGIIVFGVIVGSVNALMAMGLILIYRANRFINFAYGAMGSFGGMIAVGLHLEHGVSFIFVSIPLAVAIGVGLGALLELLVRRFQGASRLILAVASIGIAQVLGVLQFFFATEVMGFTTLVGGFEVGDWRYSLHGRSILFADMMMIAAVVPVLMFLGWFLLRTNAGIGVRAAAENTDRALLLGIPVHRLSTIVWMIAGGIAALTFILQTPIRGVQPEIASGGTVVLLPALAAAVVARMESLPIALAAGIALGVIEQVIADNSTGTPTLQNMAFLVIILGALLIQRGALSRAMTGITSSWAAVGTLKPVPEELRDLPEVKWAKRIMLSAVALAFVLVPAMWGPSNQFRAAEAMVWAMGAVALVILTGWGGHISLGQFAFVGVGALVAGNIIANHNLDAFVVLILAGLGGALVSLLVGLPALRIQGLFLAVTTLALAVALDSYVINVNNFPSIIPDFVDRPMLWERFDLEGQYAMYLFTLAFVVLSILVANSLRKARAARVIIGTRDNQRSADAASVPTTGVKLAAFVIAGVICGVAGGLHVMILPTVEPGLYQPEDSILLFSTAVIGGLGSVGGAIIGVLIFYFLGTVTALGEARLLISGAFLLVVLLVFPGGIGQLLYGVRDRALRVVAERRGILVPSLVADKRDGEEHASDESGLLSAALSDGPDGSEGDRQPAGAPR